MRLVVVIRRPGEDGGGGIDTHRVSGTTAEQGMA